MFWMRDQQRSPAYINIHVRTINAFLNWLKTENSISESLTLKQVRNPQNPIPMFSDSDVRGRQPDLPHGTYFLRMTSICAARCWTVESRRGLAASSAGRTRRRTHWRRCSTAVRLVLCSREGTDLAPIRTFSKDPHLTSFGPSLKSSAERRPTFASVTLTIAKCADE